MGPQSLPSSNARVFDSLGQLGQALDELAEEKAQPEHGALWPWRDHFSPMPAPAPALTAARVSDVMPLPRKSHSLDNWARRWREIMLAQRCSASGRADRSWPVAAVILVWLGLTGVILGGLSFSRDDPAAMVGAGAGQPDAQAVALDATFDPQVELQAAADELAGQRGRPQAAGRVPQIIQNSATPAAGKGCFGTSVEFVENPARAAALAVKTDKLLFVLNVSGDFEDTRFT